MYKQYYIWMRYSSPPLIRPPILHCKSGVIRGVVSDKWYSEILAEIAGSNDSLTSPVYDSIYCTAVHFWSVFSFFMNLFYIKHTFHNSMDFSLSEE